MKISKKFKLTLMILICVLIILVGFLGIYSKKGNVYKNILPEYLLASDFKGATTLEFEVDDSVDTVYYDKDGNKVESSEVTEENKSNYTKKEIPVNSEENLTENNYEEVIDIMEERLTFLQADQYKLDLDKKTGKILLTFEDDYPDDIKSILPMEGKLELVDSTTEDVILTYSDFTKAEATYAATNGKEYTEYTIYINLELEKSGLEKINNIDKYKTTEETTTEETESGTEESTANKFKIMFDSDEIAEVSYDDILLNNKTLRITTAENLTSNSEINSKLNINTIVSKLATMGKMPVVYTITGEEYIKSDVANYTIYIAITIGVICALVLIYFIIRYKSKGILATISFAAIAALFLILIRLTKIQISLNGIAGILGLIVLNTILINNILKSFKESDRTFSENIKNAYLKTSDTFIIILIIFAVFAFSNMTVINSMGLLVFWGWFVTLVGHLILTVPMLAIAKK